MSQDVRGTTAYCYTRAPDRKTLEKEAVYFTTGSHSDAITTRVARTELYFILD